MTSWWRRQIEIFSTWLALCEGNPPVTGGFPSKRPVTRSSDIFFDLSLNKRSSKWSRRRWFEMPWRSLWRHCKASHGTGDRALSEPMMTHLTNPTYDHLVTLIMHYIDVIMSAMASQITASRLFTQPFIQAQIKNSKALRPWPLWGEFTGGRWVPLTKCQWRGKCFHLMKSSRII